MIRPALFRDALLALCAAGFISLPSGREAGDQPIPATTSFPEAAAPPAPDRVMTIKSAGSPLTTLISVRFPPRPGLSDNFNTFFCGLTIQSNGAPQSLVTIGTDQTAEVSCESLDAAGYLSAKANDLRIGLIYNVETPNAQSQAPVVLIRDPQTKTWSLDDPDTITVSQIYDTLTLAKMNAALRK